MYNDQAQCLFLISSINRLLLTKTAIEKHSDCHIAKFRSLLGFNAATDTIRNKTAIRKYYFLSIMEHLIFTIRLFNLERISGAPSNKSAPTILMVTRAQTIIAWKKISTHS